MSERRGYIEPDDTNGQAQATSGGVTTEGLRDYAEQRLTAWAECVQRLIAVAPTEAVMRETGARFSGGGHSTPPERKAIREAAAKVVDGWLARDILVLDLRRDAALSTTPPTPDTPPGITVEGGA